MPKCKFTFQATTKPYDLEYPSQKENIEFSRFNVFDTHSVLVQLGQDNQLNFTPSGFEFFDKVMKLLEVLSVKLIAEIKANRQENEFAKFFVP